MPQVAKCVDIATLPSGFRLTSTTCRNNVAPNYAENGNNHVPKIGQNITGSRGARAIERPAIKKSCEEHCRDIKVTHRLTDSLLLPCLVAQSTLLHIAEEVSK